MKSIFNKIVFGSSLFLSFLAFAESEEIDQYTIVCTKEEEEQEEIVVSHWNDIRWDFIDASEISSFTSNSRAQISVNEDNLE